MATKQKQTTDSLSPKLTDKQRIKGLQDNLIHQVMYTSIVLENNKELINGYKAQKALMRKIILAYADGKSHAEFINECSPEELIMQKESFTD